MNDNWPLPLQTGEREFSLPFEVYRIEKLPVDIIKNLGVKVLGREEERIKIVLDSHERPEEILTNLLFYVKEYVTGS